VRLVVPLQQQQHNSGHEKVRAMIMAGINVTYQV
jgi:hypothetical protein